LIGQWLKKTSVILRWFIPVVF